MMVAQGQPQVMPGMPMADPSFMKQADGQMMMAPMGMPQQQTTTMNMTSTNTTTTHIVHPEVDVEKDDLEQAEEEESPFKARIKQIAGCCACVIIVIAVMGVMAGGGKKAGTGNAKVTKGSSVTGRESDWYSQYLKSDGPRTETSYDYSYRNSYSYISYNEIR